LGAVLSKSATVPARHGCRQKGRALTWFHYALEKWDSGAAAHKIPKSGTFRVFAGKNQAQRAESSRQRAGRSAVQARHSLIAISPPVEAAKFITAVIATLARDCVQKSKTAQTDGCCCDGRGFNAHLYRPPQLTGIGRASLAVPPSADTRIRPRRGVDSVVARLRRLCRCELCAMLPMASSQRGRFPG
jgi:hypothetical protein